MNRAFAVMLAVVLGCRPTVVAPAPAPVRPKVVVLLVIDQLPTWAFERDRSLFRGGLARLVRDGAYATGELAHANTFTAPGHASIATGAPPSVHGIVGNQWYRRAEGRERPAEYDAAAPTFSVTQPGALIEDFASARALRVDGLADVLRRESPRAHSVAVALKARAATLVAGRAPELAIWFEAEAGGMTTSKAYGDAPPPWLFELARAKPAARFVGQSWTPLDPALLARHTQISDDRPGEGDVHGLGITFPHPIVDLDAIVQTPFGDEVVVDGAIAALAAMHLGEDDVPDLLALSLNAHDYAGHTWGPDSWETLDLTLRLDAALGGLFDALDRKVGKGGWAIVMTSDHGATPLIERTRVAGARRIPPAEIAAAIDEVINAELPRGAWVAKVTSSQVYMTDAFLAATPAVRDRLLMAAAAAVAKLPGITSVHVTAPMVGTCDRRRGLDRAVCLALVPGEAGELFVVASRGSVITDYKTGSHHDAPNDDNRKVPILVMGPGIAPQTTTGSQLQVAPTVAALLGISPPPAATEAPLFVPPARSSARP